MTYYLKKGNSFFPTPEEAININHDLPLGTYTIKQDNFGNWYFEPIDNFEFKGKRYGDNVRNTDRIFNTFMSRGSSTGVMLSGEKGSGKALRVDQLVYTPDGPREIGTINVGDKVYGDNGKLTTVLGVYPQGVREIYEVLFNDDSRVYADGDHLWEVKQTTRSQKGHSKQQIKCIDGKRITSTRTKILTTNQIKEALDVGVKHVIPLCEPIEFPQSNVDIDRYLVGTLIGDGHIKQSTPTITSSDTQIIEHISQCLIEGYVVKPVTNSKYDYRICQESPVNLGGQDGNAPNWYTTQLIQLGLHGKTSIDKFIPDMLKYDSVENRFALLQGLMDTDGTITKNGSITFTTISQQLANDIVWLARSLGFRSSIQYARRSTFTYKGVKKKGQLAYTIQLTGANNDRVFRLDRKKRRIKKCSSCTKTIVNVNLVESAPAVCILVDNESHLFVTNDFTVTHNTLLSKMLSIKAMENGISTIVINEPWCGESFNQVIQELQQPCIIIFDEFEKVYDRDDQNKLLTLLDGVYSTNKLFILTCNDKYRVNEHMRNRPGRIYYMIDFKGLSCEFIEEYCRDNLKNQEYIDQLCKLSSFYAEFNFDMLKAIVEEMNLYGESPQEVLTLLNAKPEYSDNYVYQVTLFDSENNEFKSEDTSPKRIEFNPIKGRFVVEGYIKEDESGDWYDHVFQPADLKHIDTVTGDMTFINSDNEKVVLRRPTVAPFNYFAF